MVVKEKIRGNINVSLSIEKASYINDLIDRDISKIPNIRDGSSDSYECPVCGKYIYRSDEFCSKCGQRLERQ